MDEQQEREPRTRTISLEADSGYVGRLKAIAALRGQTVGGLVREALDRTVGPELASLAASDVANRKSEFPVGEGS